MNDSAKAMKRLIESDNTTAIQRLLDVSNVLWYAMYKSGEVPTYGERYWFFLAMKDAMDENAELRKLVRDMKLEHECCYLTWPATITVRMRNLGIGVGA